MATKNLSKTELKLMARLLKEAAEQYSCHGCNDYYIDNTVANQNLLIKLVETMYDPEDLDIAEHDIKAIRSTPSNEDLFTDDWILMEYLAKRCQEAST